MSQEPRALVLGATGLVGERIVNQLLDSGTFSTVVALVRRPTGRSHPRLLERVTDFADLDALPLPPVSAVFCALGTTIAKAGSREAFRRIDYDLPLRIARWARQRGAGHFLLVSSTGLSPDSKFFYIQVKAELERDIQTLGYPALDIFRPSLLLGRRKEFRFTEIVSKIFTGIFSWALVGSLRPFHPIRAEDVARAMAAAAASPVPGVHFHDYDEMIRTAAAPAR